ncbi:CpaF family protein, partial [Vibrio kanaloae]
MTTNNWLNTFKTASYQPLSLELKADLHKYVIEQMEDDGVLFSLASDNRNDLMLSVTTYIQQYLIKDHIYPFNL